MLTPRQAFKLGFLLKCAQDGLTPEQTDARIDAVLTKAALGETFGKFLDVATGVGGLGLAAGGLAGAGVGYALGQATEPPVDPDEIKKQELIQVLNQYADRARRNTAAVQYRPPKPAMRMPELFRA